jgi:hypothetical protein
MGSSATCGNNVIEPGETCGSCAADCIVRSCAATSPTAAFRFTLVAPPGQSPTAVTILIAYDSAVLSIPGSGNELSVRQRVVAAPPFPQTHSPNDLNYAARLVHSRSTPVAVIATVSFDRCQGGPAPTLQDVACTVEGCAAGAGPIEGCECIVTIP